jgi:transposase
MVSWLERHGVFCDPTMRKGQLHDLILTKKPKEKNSKTDQLLNAHGHTVVTLSPYMCDLSPTELARSKVKNYVRENNVTGDLSLKRLMDLTTEGMKM